MKALIVAFDNNFVIGNSQTNTQPFMFTSDMKRFKALTLNSVVVMGRKTWDALPEKAKPLPNRTNIILSSKIDNTLLPEGAYRERKLGDAIYWLNNGEDVFYIGGESIYRQAIEQKLGIDTGNKHRIDAEFEGDVKFPNALIEWEKWTRIDPSAELIDTCKIAGRECRLTFEMWRLK